jgi:hypothetical protein
VSFTAKSVTPYREREPRAASRERYLISCESGFHNRKFACNFV